MNFTEQHTRTLFVITMLFLLCGSCAHHELTNSSTPMRQVAATNALTTPGPSEFPEITKDKGELEAALKIALKKSSKGIPEADFNASADRLRHYLMFLGLTSKDFKKAEVAREVEEAGDEEDDSTPSNLKAIQRLFISSTQFLDCLNLTDWECLEKTPTLKPRADFRIDSQADLGAPILAGDTYCGLTKLEWRRK